MKKQHEIRFQNKRPMQVGSNQSTSMNQTRTKNFNPVNDNGQFQPNAQAIQQPKKAAHPNNASQQQQFMQTMQAVVNNNTTKAEGQGNGFLNNAGNNKNVRKI